MTVPIDYKQASANFDRFLLDLREELGLQTTHQAWGVLLGVLDVFRRRIELNDVLHFAKSLPPLLRAAFIEDWHPDQERKPFFDRPTLDREVIAYHRDHQLAQPGCTRATAQVVRRHVDLLRFEQALARLPTEASDFWHDRRT